MSTLTLEERLALKGVFETALFLIEWGHQTYICQALKAAAADFTVPLKARKAAAYGQLIVMDRIHPYLTYDRWLFANHHEFAVAHSIVYGNEGVSLILSIQAARPGRIAWLKSLIEEFST